MIRVRHSILARRRMAGLSLIEMMIALVMALIVAAGIITVFQSTSSSNRVQSQLATLQEEGRFAIHSLRDDLANANGGYCSNTGGTAGATGSGQFLDSLRSPDVLATDSLVLPDERTGFLAAPTEMYSMPSSLFMLGYDCTAAACLPVDPSGGSTGIPAMGTAVGDRVPGASVLTIRYLKPGAGWAIVPASASSGSYITTTGGTTAVNLRPFSNEPSASVFTGGLAMLASCSSAQVFAATVSGGVVTATGANYLQPADIGDDRTSLPRVFDFSKDFQTVTYYLKVVCVNGSNPCTGPTTGALVRRVNGREDIAGAGELVRGVERLNFLYGVIDASGMTEFLTANEVDTGVHAVSGDSIPCHLAPPNYTSDVPNPGGMSDAGCLWRSVQTIQVNILMDGQTPLYTLTPAEMAYIYSPDNNLTPVAPDLHAIKPKDDQGFPKELLRREFTTLVALRNYNP